MEERLWTYKNWVHKYARVHRADCAHCNDGDGSHGATNSDAGRWIGPFSLYADAKQTSEFPVTPCGHCTPSDVAS